METISDLRNRIDGISDYVCDLLEDPVPDMEFIGLLLMMRRELKGQICVIERELIS